MKKLLITVSSIFAVAIIALNTFVLAAGEGNIKSQLLLGNVTSYAWGTYWDPDGSQSSNNNIERTPSETYNNNCDFTVTITVTVTSSSSHSSSGSVSQNLNMGGSYQVVSVSYQLGTVISSSQTNTNSNSTQVTQQVHLWKNNALFRDCLNQDYVTVCTKYSECADLIKQADLMAQALAATFQ